MIKPILRRVGQWRLTKEKLKRWLPNAYYYLFYGALGSLFPFLNIYYRSIGLNPWQIGILGGLRPLIALIIGPLWCFVMNRYKLRKSVLVFSLIGWIAFTVPIGFVQHAHYEVCTMKEQPLNTSQLNRTRSAKYSTFKREVNDLYWGTELNKLNLRNTKDKRPQDSAKYHGISRVIRAASSNNKDTNNKQRSVEIGKPVANSFGLMGLTFHNKPYKDIRQPYDFKSRGSPYVNNRVNPYATTIFIEILFVVLLGQLMQAPTDDINIHYDGTFLEPVGVLFQNVPKNGIYSAVGMSALALLTGTLLAFAPKYIICGNKYGDYRIAFSMFAVLMAAALLVSLYFSFTYRKKVRSFKIFESLKELCVLSHVGFLGLVFLMGTFRGVLNNFLYWNIIEIGGSELIIGLTVVCQNISDAVLAISAPILMKYLGFVGMIFSGLASYALRFIIFSWISTSSSSWAIPSVELLQGFSHSTAWSAFILYIINYTPRSTYPVGIFIVQGLYLGLGATTGAMVAGVLIERLETNVTFRIFGLTSLFSCVLFTLTQPTGIAEILPGEIEPTAYLIDEDGYSSLSEEELLFDYNQKNVIYIPSNDEEEEEAKTFVLPSSNAPLVSTFMTYVQKTGNTIS